MLLCMPLTNKVSSSSSPSPHNPRWKIFCGGLARCMGVNISERKSGTERTKKRKKRELVCFLTARGATEYMYCLQIRAIHGFCTSYDPRDIFIPGPTQYGLSRSKTHNILQVSLKRELALPSTGSWLPSRLSSTSSLQRWRSRPVATTMVLPFLPW